MKKLVIFFLAIILVFLIYNFTYNEEYIYLSIGDELANGHTPFDTYEKSYVDYLYDYIKTNNEFAKLNEYTKEDMRITDLTKELNNTKDNKTLSQLINKAKLITISIGSEELFSKLRSNENLINKNNKKIYDFIDTLVIEYDELLTNIRKINKNQIFIIGYYNPLQNETEEIDTLFNYIDAKFIKLEEKHNITYIKLYKSFKINNNYLPNKSHAFPSLEGYSYIANEIIGKIKES